MTRRSRVPASTLRYYEERGLIRPVGRKGLRRQYGPDVTERLALIALGRVAGFSIEEIAAMIPSNGQPCIDRRVLAAKADELDKRIRQLSAIRDGLRNASVCPASSHMNCSTFRRMLNAAATRSVGSRRKWQIPRARPRRR